MLRRKLLEPRGHFPGGDIEALSVLEAAALTARSGGLGRALRRTAGGAGGDADADEAFWDAVELGPDGPVLLDALEGVFEVEVVEVGVGVVGHDDVLPLVDVGDELVRVVFEAEEVGVGGGVVVGGEFVLDAFPGGEVGGVFVAVLPDGTPGGEDGAGSGAADVGGGGEAVEEEGAEHEGVGGGGEGVELGGDVGVGGDEKGFGGRGGGGVGGGGGGGEEEGEGGGGRVGEGRRRRRQIRRLWEEEVVFFLALVGIHGTKL